MEGRVAVGVGHIDDEFQQVWGDAPEGSQVLRDQFWIRFLVAGKPQPIVEHGSIGQFLWKHRKERAAVATVRRVKLLRPTFLSSLLDAFGSPRAPPPPQTPWQTGGAVPIRGWERDCVAGSLSHRKPRQFLIASGCGMLWFCFRS